QLHEADRSGARARVRVELALLVDHAGEQCRVEVVVARVGADDRVVVQRVAEPHVPRRLGRVHVREGGSEKSAREQQREELLQRVSSRRTACTKSSSSSMEPSFTKENAAWAPFTESGSRRGCRWAAATSVRSVRTFGGAVTTTTASKRS